MTRTKVRSLLSCSVLAVAAIALGCSPKEGNYVESRNQALSTSNGLFQNGLSSNGLFQNGLFQNGLFQNGLFQNGLFQNGLFQNGLFQNGLFQNGLFQNGLWDNGLFQNGIWQPGLTGNAAIPGDSLRSSPYLRELLQYVYACGMPAKTYDTTLDPNNGTLKCSSSDAGSDGGATCDDGYTCSSDGTCVIPLTGSIGLGINADGTTWWGTPGQPGKCDETCQRWVSACLLARTNAYGKHVEISMRAPADAPKAIKDALAAGDRERSACPMGDTDPTTCGYTLPEGAYYGNLFQTTPVDPQPGPTVGPDGGVVLYSGPVIGLSKLTPAFNACAGPGSNIPGITNRFVSSQGDQTVVSVPGTCLPTPNGSGLCVGADPTSGGMQDCSDSNGQTYKQVITVYLKKPSATHGDGVCEDGEESKVTADGLPNPLYDPSDCPPGWAKDFPPAYGFGAGIVDLDPSNTSSAKQGMSAVAPDGTIVVVGQTSSNIDLNKGTTCVPGAAANSPDCLWASNGLGVLARYDSAGNYLGGIRFQPGNPAPAAGKGWDVAGGVTVDPSSGTIIVVGSTVDLTTGVSVTDSTLYPANASSIWVSTFQPCATASCTTPMGPPVPLQQYSLPVGNWEDTTKSYDSDVIVTRAVALDPQGNIVLAVGYCGTMNFVKTDGTRVTFKNTCAPAVLPKPFSVQGQVQPQGLFVAKLSPLGTVWAQSLAVGLTPVLDGSTGNADGNAGLSLGIDSVYDNNIVLLTGGNGAALQKLSTIDGSTIWTKAAGSNAVYAVATIGDNDDIYVGGHFQAGQDFGCGAGALTSVAGLAPFLMKVTGNPITSTIVIPELGITKHVTKPAGTCMWENHANIVCPPGSTVVNGVPTCGGALNTSYAPLVSGLSISFDPNHNVILGSFGNPTISPQNPTVGGGGGISFGSALGTFLTYHSNNIFLSGYRPDNGQVLWAKQIPTVLSSFLLGMEVDSQYHVVMSGNYSGSMLANNRLLVTGIPQDPKTVDSFLTSFGGPDLTDTMAPGIGTLVEENGTTINTVPKHIIAQATAATGASVFFVPPTAVDSPSDTDHAGISVVCLPRPNSVFPIGDTTVTCTASDPLGNSSSKSFTVTVADLLGPVFSPYADITTQATSASGAPVTYPTPTATDQVAGAVTPVCLPASGSLFPIGTTKVTCTAVDQASPPNQSQMTFSVTVTPPPVTAACVGTAGAPVTLTMSPGLCGATVSNGGLGGVCSGGAALTACTFDGAASETLGLGDHSVAVIGTAGGGSTSSCTSYVHVVDNQKPLVACANQKVECAGSGGTTVTPGATCADNCSCTTSCGTAALFPLGTTNRSCTATDAAGNSATCQDSITVVDTLAPVLTLNSSAATLQCGVDAYVEAGAKATDSCAGDLTSKITKTSAASTTAVGTKTVTYSVADPSGNSASAVRTVSVVDTLAPKTTATVGPSKTADVTINITLSSYSVTPKGGGTTVTGSASCWTSLGIAIALSAVDACAQKQITYALTGAQTGGATVAGGAATVTVTTAGSTSVSYFATDKAGNNETATTLPIFVGKAAAGFGFSCAPSPSLKNLPAHGTVTAKGTVTITNTKTGQKVSSAFSFTQTY